MTSLAVRLNEKLRSSTINTVLAYLDEPDRTTDARGQKKIHVLVTNTLSSCWPKTVFHLPLPGKPNPRLQLDSLLKTPRPRVLQLGQKGMTCLYYALQRIRLHVGKNPTEQFAHMRTVEKRASEWRKERTRIDKIFKRQRTISLEPVPFLGPVTKENIAVVLMRLDQIIQQPEDVEKIRSLYKKFQQSSFDTLVHFVDAKHLTELCIHYQKYLSSYKIPKEAVYNSVWSSSLSLKWEALSLTIQSYCLSNGAFRVMYKNYGLKHSSWHPTQPIEELGLQIEAHGPHVILGGFGEKFYAQSLFRTSCKIEGRCVYAWPPNANRIDQEGYHHAVVLVGVDCDKKLVFFIDPVNPSDPEQPSQEKIYVISYENLKRNIYSIYGLKIVGKMDNVRTQKFPLGHPYAIHGDPELARL